MSNKTTKVVDSEQRTDTIIGIITVLAVLALIVWLFASVSIRGAALSELSYADEMRRGTEQTFTADVKTSKVKDGETVKWLVNGRVVEEGVYTKGEPLTLNYTPQISGPTSVVLQVGKYNKAAYFDVLPPRLTLSVPNVTVCYGDDTPNVCYDSSGYVCDDCKDMLEYEGKCRVYDDNGVELASEKLDVGVYRLNLDQDCCFKDYEVEYVGGTLTVLPKKLSAQGHFVKIYDQCNTIENPTINLVGVEEGDEVTAKCDKLYFDNKNAGNNKTIMLANVELVGEDSNNYVLESTAQGAILPKNVAITGLSVRDKAYDGTTRAQIDKMGTLNGVIEGDSVAIGSIELSFAEADAGEQQIVLNDVSLVGADKDNYIVGEVNVQNASINTTLWNRIFVKNPVVGASDNVK